MAERRTWEEAFWSMEFVAREALQLAASYSGNESETGRLLEERLEELWHEAFERQREYQKMADLIDALKMAEGVMVQAQEVHGDKIEALVKRVQKILSEAQEQSGEEKHGT